MVALYCHFGSFAKKSIDICTPLLWDLPVSGVRSTRAPIAKNLRKAALFILLHVFDIGLSNLIQPPKGAKVYPASRRRSNKRVGLKGQLAPHCVT